MKLEILSPVHSLFKGEVSAITLPGTLGSFTVLKDHAPLISSLAEGVVRYVMEDGQEKELPIKRGFVEVKQNEVSVCVEN